MSPLKKASRIILQKYAIKTQKTELSQTAAKQIANQNIPNSQMSKLSRIKQSTQKKSSSLTVK